MTKCHVPTPKSLRTRRTRTSKGGRDNDTHLHWGVRSLSRPEFAPFLAVRAGRPWDGEGLEIRPPHTVGLPANVHTLGKLQVLSLWPLRNAIRVVTWPDQPHDNTCNDIDWKICKWDRERTCYLFQDWFEIIVQAQPWQGQLWPPAKRKGKE